MLDDILQAVLLAIRLALKAGVPAQLLRGMVDDEEKLLPSREAELAADTVFDRIVKERFPEDK